MNDNFKTKEIFPLSFKKTHDPAVDANGLNLEYGDKVKYKRIFYDSDIHTMLHPIEELGRFRTFESKDGSKTRGTVAIETQDLKIAYLLTTSALEKVVESNGTGE